MKLKILLFIIIALAAGYLYLNQKKPEILTQYKIPQLKNLNFKNQNFQKLSTDANQQLATLSGKAAEVGSHVQNVLGKAITVNEDEEKKSIQAETIDYAKYLYCKQVVEDYETKQKK